MHPFYNALVWMHSSLFSILFVSLTFHPCWAVWIQGISAFKSFGQLIICIVYTQHARIILASSSLKLPTINFIMHRAGVYAHHDIVATSSSPFNSWWTYLLWSSSPFLNGQCPQQWLNDIPTLDPPSCFTQQRPVWCWKIEAAKANLSIIPMSNFLPFHLAWFTVWLNISWTSNKTQPCLSPRNSN